MDPQEDIDMDSTQVDSEAPTQLMSPSHNGTQIDEEAPTQIMSPNGDETQIDEDAPTQIMSPNGDGTQIDDEAPTQIVCEEEIASQIDTEAATQVPGTQIDEEAPTQLPEEVDGTQIDTEAPTQAPMDEEACGTQIDTEAATQVPNEEADTQLPNDNVDEDAPTQVERVSRSRSRSASRSVSRSRSGSSRSSVKSAARSRSVSRSRSRSRSGSRSRSVSVARSRSGSRSSRSRSRSKSPASRKSSRSRSPASRKSSRSRSPASRKSSRSRSPASRRSSRSRSRSKSRSSDSGDDIGKAKKRVVREAFGDSDDDEGKPADESGGSDKKKRKRIVTGGSDESGDEAAGGPKSPAAAADSEEADEGPKAGPSGPPATADDSSEDEGVLPDGQAGASLSSNELISDFDLMMERKKAEKRGRRRKKDIDLINDNDDAIAKMIADMRLAAREDRDLNLARQPAVKKISMLPAVMTQLWKADLQMAFVEANVLSVLTDWLAPMPDKSLPSIQIRKAILKLLFELRLDDHTRLKESGIGKAVMYLYKHPKELRTNKELAGKIINQWARPIFNLSTNFKDISREDRIARDQMSGTRRKREVEESNDNEEALRPGDPGWCYRARVPQTKTNTYVNRPEWTSHEDISTGSTRKQTNRLEKHIRNQMERKKNSKSRRAIEISIEGRKMAL